MKNRQQLPNKTQQQDPLKSQRVKCKMKICHTTICPQGLRQRGEPNSGEKVHVLQVCDLMNSSETVSSIVVQQQFKCHVSL